MTEFLKKSHETDDEIIDSGRDIEKLNAMWKSLKDSKKNLKHISNPIDESEEKISRPDIKNNFNKDETINDQEPFKNNEYYESLLVKTKERNSVLIQKLAEAQEEIEACHEKMARERSENLRKSEKLEEMSSQVEQLVSLTSDKRRSEKFERETIMQESERPDIRILKMECYIKDLENHIKTLEIKNDDFKIQIELLQQELSLKQNENLRLKNKIEETEKAIDVIILKKENEDNALLELSYFKNDVRRLLKLLQSTQEFREFSLFAVENENEIHYIKELSKRFSDQAKEKIHTIKKRSCCKNEEHKEKNFWAPSETVEIMNFFSNKYNNKIMNEEIMNSILLELNKIWNDREAKKISKLKIKQEQEMGKLKRYYSSLVGMTEVQAKKTISHLQYQMREKSKQENKENVYPRQENEKREEINERISSEYKENRDYDYDKKIYLEGALWMNEKVLKEFAAINDFLVKLNVAFKEKLTELIETRQLTESLNEKNEFWNFFEWMNDNFYEIFNSYKDKVASMKEKIEKRMTIDNSFVNQEHF